MAGRIEYAQAREIIIRPPDAATQQRWLSGLDVPEAGAARVAAQQARSRLNVHPAPMIGSPQNVDGELKGWFPARLRVAPRVLAVLVPPPTQGIT